MVLIPVIIAATGLLVVLITIILGLKRSSKESLPEEVILCILRNSVLTRQGQRWRKFAAGGTPILSLLFRKIS
jgi:hypothetical protein